MNRIIKGLSMIMMVWFNDSMKNKISENSLMNRILVYSAIKIMAKVPDLYSVLNPETNSDSPSARSNGVRFVSARAVAIHRSESIGRIIMLGR